MQRQTMTLDCPKSMIGRVIGKNGETVKALQVFTGASIQIDQVFEPARIIVSGTTQALQLAASMVADIINGTFRGFSLLRQLANSDSRQSGQPPLAMQMVYAPGYGLIPATEQSAAASRISKVADHQQSLLGPGAGFQNMWPGGSAPGASTAVEMDPQLQPAAANVGLQGNLQYAPGTAVGQLQVPYQPVTSYGLGRGLQGMPGGMAVQYVPAIANMLLPQAGYQGLGAAGAAAAPNTAYFMPAHGQQQQLHAGAVAGTGMQAPGLQGAAGVLLGGGGPGGFVAGGGLGSGHGAAAGGLGQMAPGLVNVVGGGNQYALVGGNMSAAVGAGYGIGLGGEAQTPVLGQYSAAGGAGGARGLVGGLGDVQPGVAPQVGQDRAVGVAASTGFDQPAAATPGTQVFYLASAAM